MSVIRGVKKLGQRFLTPPFTIPLERGHEQSNLSRSEQKQIHIGHIFPDGVGEFQKFVGRECGNGGAVLHAETVA